jgi:hypothetical protein
MKENKNRLICICIRLTQVCTKLSSIKTYVRNTSLKKINSNVISFYNKFIQNSYLNHLFIFSEQMIRNLSVTSN